MSAQPQQCLTTEEYLAGELAGSVRHEFWGGRVLEMVGSTLLHSTIKDNLTAALNAVIRAHGCRAYSADTLVHVSANGDFFYPDVFVVCGEPEFLVNYPGRAVCNPIVIIEVLSPSTELFDRYAKFESYKQLPTLKEYVLVSQSHPIVEAFELDSRGKWARHAVLGRSASFAFGAMKATVPLAEIYLDAVTDDLSSGGE
jgi:Uma2 family endonuclease